MRREKRVCVSEREETNLKQEMLSNRNDVLVYFNVYMGDEPKKKTKKKNSNSYLLILNDLTLSNDIFFCAREKQNKTKDCEWNVFFFKYKNMCLIFIVFFFFFQCWVSLIITVQECCLFIDAIGSMCTNVIQQFDKYLKEESDNCIR